MANRVDDKTESNPVRSDQSLLVYIRCRSGSSWEVSWFVCFFFRLDFLPVGTNSPWVPELLNTRMERNIFKRHYLTYTRVSIEQNRAGKEE